MRRRAELRLGMMALIVAGCLFTTPSHAMAGEFRAILWNVTDAKDPQAHIDVGIDTRGAAAGTDVLFSVYDMDGILLSEFTLQVDARGFVSSLSAAPPNNNLYAVSGGQPASVTVKFPQGATNADAVLYQTLKASKVVLGVPWLRDQADFPVASGTLFSVTVGNFSRASLLVANVSGTDLTVDVFVGTAGAPGAGKYSLPDVKNNMIARIDLDPSDSNSHLVMRSTGDIVAQLVVDTGKSTITQVTLVPVQH